MKRAHFLGIWAAGCIVTFIALSFLLAFYLQQDNAELAQACKLLHDHALTSKGC